MDRGSTRSCRPLLMGTASVPQRATFGLALAGLVSLGALQLRTPDVVPATAPADAFSADRAAIHLEALASSSRAVGTPGHSRARRYLYDVMADMGLETQIQEAKSHVRFQGAPDFSAGTVHNVLGRVPGTRSTGAIVVNAHYDSGTTGPGASDCGSCVVTALETLRALLAGEALRNDVIFVFSDAEEEGDLGAAAFVGQHPWAADVRVAINYEAQGSGGPAFLYATSPQSGWLVRAFLDVAPDATAYSWMRGIMDLYPAGQLECDLAEYMKVGVEGLGFVYVGDSQDYHTVRDNVDRIDLGSVQQEGAYTLALVRRLGDMDLEARVPSSDLVYFNLLPGVVAAYSESWVVPLALLATGLLLFVVLRGVRSGVLRPRRVLGATVLAGTAVAVAVGLVSLLWVGIRNALPAVQVSLVGTYNSGLWIAGLMALVGAIMTGAILALVRRFGSFATGAGAMLALHTVGVDHGRLGSRHELCGRVAPAVLGACTGPRPARRRRAQPRGMAGRRLVDRRRLPGTGSSARHRAPGGRAAPSLRRSGGTPCARAGLPVRRSAGAGPGAADRFRVWRPQAMDAAGGCRAGFCGLLGSGCSRVGLRRDAPLVPTTCPTS